MLRNVAMAIESMQNDLPGLEVTSLKLDDIIKKQRKARVSVGSGVNEYHYRNHNCSTVASIENATSYVVSSND